MSAAVIRRAAFALYLLVFFVFLFGPLAVMAVAAFNRATWPQAMPFEGATLHWFAALAGDAGLMQGLANSLLIGVLVVLLAVPLGLAGALAMQHIHARARGLFFLVLVSPVLTPGIIIGISTVIFWRSVAALAGTRALYDGIVLTVLGQSSFIAAYCMLVFLARLQRFDAALADAARDLGARPAQVFAHILLPFLRPAVLSAAVLAFLASFENYNTTTFAILADRTLTTVLAGRVRQGMTPALAALAVVIIALTVLGAVAYEALRRREERQRSAGQRAAREAARRELAALPQAT
jgi:spermidine/putrescine transport system permease protein